MSRAGPRMAVTAGLLVAGLAAIAGAWAMRPLVVPPPAYEDTGEPLFPGFDDPSQAQLLEVIAWDAKAAGATRFSVALIDGRWVIPSHANYPADAVDRMASAAAGFIGARKDQYRGDDPADFAKYGVEDPEDPEASAEGRGTHVRIGDASQESLVDVILGRELPDKPGFRFVRPVGSDRVYASQIRLELSTDFGSWIDPDLLGISRAEIVAITSNAYRVDEKDGRVIDHQPVRFEMRGEGQWVQVLVPEGSRGKAIPVGQLPVAAPPPGKSLDNAVLARLLGGLDGLKIVGVRPQPELLTQGALLEKGFFVSKERGSLFGNEGELAFQTRDGLNFTLFFGEVSYDSGEALTAGLAASQGADPVPGDDAKAHRYMFVTAGYDPSLDATRDPGAGPGAPPASEPGQAPDTPGAARADALRARFDRWFYVVEDASFQQIHKRADEFFGAPAGEGAPSP